MLCMWLLVWVYARVGVCTCGWLCIRAHAGGDDSNIGCLSSTVLHLYFLRWSPLLSPKLIDSVRLAGQWIRDPATSTSVPARHVAQVFSSGAGDPTQVLMLDWNYYSQSYYNVNTGESTSCSNDSVSVRRAWTVPTSVNQLKEHIDSYVWHHGMRYSDSPKHNTLHQTQCSILCWKLAEGKMCPLSPLWRLFRIKRALFSWPLKPTLQRNKNYTISAHGTNMKDDLNWSPEDLFLVGLGNELPLYLRLWASFSTSRTELIGASDIADKKRTVDRWAFSA